MTSETDEENVSNLPGPGNNHETTTLQQELLQSKLLQEGMVPDDMLTAVPSQGSQQQGDVESPSPGLATPNDTNTPSDPSANIPTSTASPSTGSAQMRDLPVATLSVHGTTGHDEQPLTTDTEGDQVVYSAQPVKEEECLVKKKHVCLILVALVIVAVIVIPVSVAFVRRRNNRAKQASSTGAIWYETQESALYSVATTTLPKYTIRTLQNDVATAHASRNTSTSSSTAADEWYMSELWNAQVSWTPPSPQGQAWKWLVSDPAATGQSAASETYAETEITTRFALAVLFFATDGPNSWDNTTNWLSTSTSAGNDNDLCTWFSSTVGNAELYPNERIKKYDDYVETCRATGFRELRLASNKLVGQLPSEIGLLTTLTTLSLNFNELGGAVPTTISQLTRLRTLDCLGCGMTGSTDTVFGTLASLTNLAKLRLGTNKFRGTLPVAIGNLEKITDLRLYDNRMHGTIPDELWAKWGGMEFLRLNNNNFRGTLPTLIGSMTGLKCATLNVNSLTGTVPSEIGSLSMIRQLAIAYNKFDGTLPSTLGQLTSLEYLLFASNRFTGTIFSEIGNLKSIYYLDLELQEDLRGTIPTSIGLLRPSDFYLGINHLTGTIPSEIGNWADSVSTFSFGGNNLTGTVPTTLGLLTKCYAFFLALNQLSGTIPTELGTAKAAAGIDFSNNLLTGTIPTELANCPVLDQLLLSSNQLSGTVPSAVCSKFPSENLDKILFIDCDEVQCSCNCTCKQPFES